MLDFTVAIIAGGESSRMGTNKALLQLGDKPLIEHVIQRTELLGQLETILITNSPDDYAYLNLPMYSDVISDSGSLGGIYTALVRSTSPFTVVLACDMPFVNPKVICYLLSQITPTIDAVVPQVNDISQGLHAIYSKTCLPTIKKAIDKQQLKIGLLLEQVRVQYVDEKIIKPFDPDLFSFFNVNTPDDLKTARETWAKPNP